MAGANGCIVFVDATASGALAIETVARCRLEGNMMRIAWLLAGALLVPTQALPRTKTGNELLYDCTHDSAINQVMCLGFIDGIAENPHKDFGVFCIPEEVPLAQLWERANAQLSPRGDGHAAVALAGRCIEESSKSEPNTPPCLFLFHS
jgi:hypothetical protein